VTSDETRVLDAALGCVERFGFSKVTIDDITAASGVSRATIYRLFPGGREVLFEAMRLRELESFFSRLPVDSTSVGLGSFIAYLLIFGLGLVMPLMTFETRFALLYSFISINSPL
jgi:AcrR family transcriptional regulator